MTFAIHGNPGQIRMKQSIQQITFRLTVIRTGYPELYSAISNLKLPQTYVLHPDSGWLAADILIYLPRVNNHHPTSEFGMNDGVLV